MDASFFHGMTVSIALMSAAGVKEGTFVPGTTRPRPLNTECRVLTVAAESGDYVMRSLTRPTTVAMSLRLEARVEASIKKDLGPVKW